MKNKFFKKSLIISIICLLIIPTIAVAASESTSNYNLKVKIKNVHILYNSTTDLCFSVNVSNEGPDYCDNYSIKIETFLFIGWGRPIRTWFSWTGMERTYIGSAIAPNDYEKTLINCTNFGPGWYLTRAIIYSDNTNMKDDVSYCTFHVYHHWPPLFGP